MTTTFTFATVVFEEELPLLKLQARSISKFVAKENVDKIIIFVNDAIEERVKDLVREIQPEYGVHQDRVQILTGNDIFPKPKLTHFFKFGIKSLPFFFYFPLFQRKPKGWRGFSGWQVQQAFKIMSGYYCTSPYMLILDAKNILLRDFILKDYVAQDGKPKAQFMPITNKARVWLDSSSKSIDADIDIDNIHTVTQFTTPFCVRPSLLCQAADLLRHKWGTTQTAFTLLKQKPTEFMILNALCYHKYGNINSEFSPGLPKPISLFLSNADAIIEEKIVSMEKMEHTFIGLHAGVIGRLTEAQTLRISNLLTNTGVTMSDEQARSILKDLSLKNMHRTAQSKKRSNVIKND
jgi:hypothetical protein